MRSESEMRRMAELKALERIWLSIPHIHPYQMTREEKEKIRFTARLHYSKGLTDECKESLDNT